MAFVSAMALGGCSDKKEVVNDVRFTMLTSVLSMAFWRLGFSYILCVQMGMGAVGVWIAMVVDWVCRVTCFAARFLCGAWRKKALSK